jgi:CheY-like chemotaxis protein
VAVEITDNGAGIDPLLVDRVFDPFFTTKRGVGVGLGLPICHSIITGLGGEIKVESQIGRGTAFRVVLPAEAALPSPQRRAPPAPKIEGSRRLRVLVVDDELPLASMLSRVLSDEHDVEVTTHAKEALALLQSRPFDVVLCDLLMPVMSGMDLYRELKLQRPGLAARVVFMTGGAFTPRAAEFLASVPNPCVEKPFDLNAVRRLVHQLGASGRL